MLYDYATMEAIRLSIDQAYAVYKLNDCSASELISILAMRLRVGDETGMLDYFWRNYLWELGEHFEYRDKYLQMYAYIKHHVDIEDSGPAEWDHKKHFICNSNYHEPITKLNHIQEKNCTQ